MKENRYIPGVYSYKQFLRHLIGLEAKKFLTIVHRPVNQESQMIVALRPALRLDMYVQADGHVCPGGGGNGGSEKPVWTPTSRRRNPGNGDPTKAREERPDMGVQAAPQLSLAHKAIKKELEAWLTMDQKDLIKAVMGLVHEDLEYLEMRVYQIAPRAKGKKPSRKAKLYAGIRYIQDPTQARNPQAWIEGVAKRAQQDLERMQCGGGRSGSAGRSPFRQRYGGG